MLPFRLQPVFKDYLWGGKKLIDSWGKNSTEPLAESWELSAHKDGDNIILDGSCKGLTLSETVKAHPEIVAMNFSRDDLFPMIVKLIDSAKTLSVQVHPDDDYAMKFEKSKGKSELWYILDHEQGASLFLGFKRDTTHKEIENAINNHTLIDLLNKFEVHKGDLFYLPPGTIHAIGAGITLAEFQDNSNITYRVYDFGRPRELHVAKALDVLNTSKYSRENITCKKFHIEKINIDGKYSITKNSGSFMFVLCIEGECRFTCRPVCRGRDFTCEIHKGDNIFIPADCEYSREFEGKSELLCAIIPQALPSD